MFNNKFFISAISACIISTSINATELVKPELTTKVDVSSTDVNRIKCGDGIISGVHYSQDKNIVVEVKDSNAYIKFMALKEGDDVTYSERASEMFVTCGGDVYELILLPTISNAKTIYLSNPIKNQIKANIEKFGSLPLEDNIVSLSLALMTEDDSVLQQFSVKEIKPSQQEWFNFDKTTKVGRTEEFTVDGLGVKVSKYNIVSTVERRFNPTEFLDTRISENIMGLTLDPEVVRPKEVATLIVVEKDVNNGR